MTHTPAELRKIVEGARVKSRLKLATLYIITCAPVFLFINVTMALCGLTWEWVWLQIAWIISSVIADIAKDLYRAAIQPDLMGKKK